MASIKNLKKSIDYTLGEVYDLCNAWELSNPSADTKESESIKNELFDVFDNLQSKMKAKGVENKAAHFKAISAELESKANELLDKVNKL
jgi:hypothetical protein